MKKLAYQFRFLVCTILGTLLFVFGAVPAGAQTFKLEGGSSSLLHVHGASMEMHAPNYTARAGIGYMDGVRTGFTFIAPYRGWLWELGDQSIPFTLPTDLFQRSYYFLGRGVGVSRKTDRDRLFLYGGASSRGYFSPFLRAAAADTGMGLLFYERKLSPSFRFFSHNLLSNRQTALQSLEWTAREDLQFGLAGGLGNNQGYWSSSMNFAREKVALLASYTHAGDSFRRVTVETPAFAESDRENLRLELVPQRNLRFFASRQHLLSPEASPARRDRATVNGVGFAATALSFQFHGSLYDATTRAGRSGALAVGARRDLVRWLNVSLDYLRSDPSSAPASHSVISTFREILNPRLSLSQIVAHSNGQTTVAFGGSFLSNRMTVGMEYQTIYVPFQQANGSSFRQVLMVNLRMKLPRGLEISGATHVTPLGKVRYTGYASGFLFRGAGESGGPGAKFYDYVVQGHVVDEKGEPIRGAALRIGGEMVFSDSEGAVFLRRKKADDCPIEVALDEFILPGSYEVIDMPNSVRPAKEESAQWFEVRLKRVRTQPAEVGGAESGEDVRQNETVVHPGAELSDIPLTRSGVSSESFTPMLLAYGLPVNTVNETQRQAPPTTLRAPARTRPVVRKSKPARRPTKASKRNKRAPARATSRNRRTPVASATRAKSGPVAKRTSTSRGKSKPVAKRAAVSRGKSSPVAKRASPVKAKPVAKRGKSRPRGAGKSVAYRPRPASKGGSATGGR